MTTSDMHPQDGPNALSDCSDEFVCCKYDNSDNRWEETACTCNNGNVFVQVYGIKCGSVVITGVFRILTFAPGLT